MHINVRLCVLCSILAIFSLLNEYMHEVCKEFLYVLKIMILFHFTISLTLICILVHSCEVFACDLHFRALYLGFILPIKWFKPVRHERKAVRILVLIEIK